MHSFIKVSCTVLCCLVVYSCGVSDYINRKKISRAPAYKAPPKTSECEFNQARIERVVNYINRIRAHAQTCEGRSYQIAPAIRWNQKLYMAAKNHSDDMATNNFLDHQGPHGLVPGDRVSNAGYQWKSVAENIAGGTDTPEQTIEQWLSSHGHCHNLMNPAHTQIGLACTRNNIADYRIYWTLVLASPNTHSE